MYLLFLTLMISLSYFLYKGYKNTKSVTINHIKIDEKQPPQDSSLLRILHISDMHIENLSITPMQVIEHVSNHTIDLVALTGDFLDRKRSIPKLIPYLKELSKINPAYGMYAVFGNHDYVLRDAYFNQLKEVLKIHGIKTLQNEADSINVEGKLLNIIGIDNFSTNHSNLEKSFAGTTKGYNLVLTHDPNIVLTMKNYHFDYMLSGHFHGGQIHWPKPYHLIKMGKLVKMNMVKGLHRINGRPFYISEGLGQTGINIRIGSKPEITFHNLHVYHEGKEKNGAIIAG